MAKEGWWMNWKNPEKRFYVHDHEDWIRQGDNAKKLGVPQNIINDFPKFERSTSHEAFLIHIMKHVPVMRVRGHGVDTTFEYYAHERQDPMWAVYMFARTEHAGPYSWLNISNLATREYTSITWQDFKKVMDEDGPEGVMRMASRKFSKKGESMIHELLRVAKEIAGKHE